MSALDAAVCLKHYEEAVGLNVPREVQLMESTACRQVAGTVDVSVELELCD